MKPFQRRLFDVYMVKSDLASEDNGRIFVLSEIVDSQEGPLLHLWDIDLVNKGNNFKQKRVVHYAQLVEDYISMYRYLFPVSDRYVFPGGSYFREVRMMIPAIKPEWISYDTPSGEITIVMRSFLRADGEEYLMPYAVK